jgi:hypothetical protein
MTRPQLAPPLLLALALFAFCGCAANGRPVAADETAVAGGQMTVKPRSTWKKLPAGSKQRRWEEVWTWSGPQQDRVTLIGGLPDGKTILFQKKNVVQQVPLFQADMTPLDLAAMLEVSYRVNGVTAFEYESMEPADFLGGRGIRLRYRYASGIGYTKRGRCVLRVIGQKLYAMKLDGVGSHYDAAVPDFEQLVASARLIK